jgi:hypothetical protein
MATYLDEVQFEMGAAQAALAMDDPYCAQLHVRKAETLFGLASLPQEIYATCVNRGVVPDDDLIRLDMQGRAMFAPIVAKPTLIQGRYGWAHGETMAKLATRVGGYGTGVRMCDECFDMVYPKTEDAGEDGWIKCPSCGEKTFKVNVVKPKHSEFCSIYIGAGCDCQEPDPIVAKPLVWCPVHGNVPFCKDVENGGCSKCSDEFHRELLDDRDVPSECWPYVDACENCALDCALCEAWVRSCTLEEA